MSKRPKIQWQWNLILWRRKLLPKRWKIFLYCFFLVLIKFREIFYYYLSFSDKIYNLLQLTMIFHYFPS